MVETSPIWKLFHQKLPTLISTHRSFFTVLWILGFASLFLWQKENLSYKLWLFNIKSSETIPNTRPVVFSLVDFGGKGDGITMNTNAFEKGVREIKKLGKKGGGQLNVPKGYWLTAPFNLTSHMTLFLDQGAVILATQEEKYWPLLPALPSYGYGREHPGPRYGSLIHGQHLKDVDITGHNGTIDGQGQPWWKKHSQKSLNYTRGPLLQIMWSSDIRISNITLRDSPFWNIHPFDCKNISIKDVTILAPLHGAPNTDGIDPDSCENMMIENCYISVGDDAIAIKSGWDQYGIAYAQPSTNILIRNLIVQSMVSAGISIGSEMSGGVSNITIENVLVWNSRRGMRIKTAAGRGGYIRHITYKNITLDNVRVGIVIKTDYNEHPDDGYDRKAFPILGNFTFNGIHGQGVRVPVRLHGSEDIPLRNIVFRNMSVGTTYKKKHIFQCGFVQGRVIGTIFPAPCDNFDLYNEQEQLVKRSTSQNITDIDYDI